MSYKSFFRNVLQHCIWLFQLWFTCSRAKWHHSHHCNFNVVYTKGVAFIRAAQQLLTSPHFTPHYMTTGNREQPKSVPSSNGTFTCLNCPKLCNQVPSLSLSRWRTLTLLKIKRGCVFLCFKLETIVSSALIHSTLLSSWLVTMLNIKTPNLSIFSTG